ncbi:MAG: hypothetical protein HRU46_15655, partial [Verrucomicrobiales bacterium]|nr:hypothetical protein [Verrucomicrobiales bacterium]
GMGEGDFGAGVFGGDSDLGTELKAGGGGTMFGSRGGEGLVGTFYDLKQTPDGKPTKFAGGISPGDFYGLLGEYGKEKFSPSVVEGYYQAKEKMSYTYLLIPDMDAREGPAAFNVEREVEPKGWFVHYSGYVAAPRDGVWRFVGRFDDAVMVYVNDQLVLDGGYRIATPGVSEPFTSQAFANGKPAFAGKWVSLRGQFKLDILIGERPGGFLGGGLLVEEKSGDYEKRADGSPIIPVFSTAEFSSKDLMRLADYPYDIAETTPVFKMYSRQ